MNRSDLLSKAAELIDGQRAKDYGDAAENFGNVAQGWSVILGQEVLPEQVAFLMTWLKICRLTKSPGNHIDSWIDSAGYIALGAEIATEKSA